MKPADALIYRELLCTSSGHVTKATCDCPDDPEGDGPECPHYRWIDHVKNLTRRAPVYFVSDEMQDVAIVAAKTMPASVPVSTLPSPTGFLLFPKPVGSDTDDETAPSEHIPVLCWDRDFIYPVLADNSRPVGHVWTFPGRVPWEMVPDLADLPHPLEEGIAAVRPFLAASLLMQQAIARIEHEAPDRASRRRALRAGLPASNVIVARLRKIERGQDKETGDLVAWSHRWLVSGHWRQQYHPSDHSHRPLWISPHVKGPESKPLIVKDRVTAWVR